MSLARLLFSGLLVAAGLILGAFTLQGYLDPQWAQKQAQAAGPRERHGQPRTINTFQGRNRFVSRREQANAPAKPQPPATHAPASTSAAVKAADAKAAAAKAAAKKKLAEKIKKPPQQAALQWPWNLFSN